MKQWIQAIWAGNESAPSIEPEDVAAAAHAMAKGEASEAQCAAFITGMRMKGETEDEIAAFVLAFRHYRLPIRAYPSSLSSGGSSIKRHAFPVSLAVSLLLAAAGFPQALTLPEELVPGGDAASGYTLTELLERLGIDTGAGAAGSAAGFAQARIGCFRAADVCPPLARLAAVREQLGIPSLLQDAERALNPLESAQLLLGVRDRSEQKRWGPLTARLGYQSAFLVHGLEGSEDLPLHKPSHVQIVSPYSDETRLIDPLTFGFYGEPLPAAPVERHADMLKRVLQGEESQDVQQVRDHVVFNAGLRLHWCDKVGAYEDGFQLAASLLQRREAWKRLELWRRLSRESAAAGGGTPERETGT